MNESESSVVLIVEDNPEHQEMAARAFAGHEPRHQIMFATSGAAALHLLHLHGIDAVILDDTLPDGDSLAILSEIKLRPNPPPVVMACATVKERDIVEAMKRGASDFLVKSPDSMGAFPTAVERAIETAKLHERVRTTERQYRDLLESSNDAIYILVGERFRYVNQRFAEMFGWSVEDLTDPDFEYAPLIAEESRPLVAERERRTAANEPLPSRYEFVAVRRDRSKFDAEVSVAYIHYDGEPAVLGILTDITARKAYEKALLRKNRELSVLNAVAEATTRARDLAQILDVVVERIIELLEVDSAGIAIIEPDRRQLASIHFRGASETFVREMRQRGVAAPIIAKTLETEKMQIYHDLRDSELGGSATQKEGFCAAVSLPLVSHGRCSGIINIFSRKKRIFSEEEIHLFIAVARQIAVAIENARLYKKAQEGIARLQALSEITRAIGSTLEVEGVFRIVGDRLQKIIPYRKITLKILRRDGQGFSVRTIDRPGPGEATIVRLHEPRKINPMSPHQRALESRTTIVVPSGENGIGSVTSAIVPIVADNKPMGVFVVAIDEALGFRERDLDLLRDLAANMAISLKNARVFQDLERAYRDLKDTKDRLVRSEKLQGLGEMAAGVAHDFNNVLSAILGRAQMLKVLVQDQEVLKSLRVIEKAALDGAGTVRRIQEFAKSKSEGDHVLIHMNPLVRDAIDLSTTRLNEMGIEIDLQVQLGEAGAVLGNPTELREVLTNLIYNAIDAMPHGGRLAIRTGSEPIKRMVWFEVEDTGVGMDEETQRKIFDPFFTTKGTRGTGLGLSVSYGIVQRHKGEFSVKSRRGTGSTIRVTFPMPEGETSGFASKDNLTPLPSMAKNKPDSARILVIDDDNAVRDVLADILRTGDHHVVSAANGPEGLELFKRAEFDLVFTDLGMPGMNGWEVAQGIKSLRPGTPVGLITGWGASLDEARIKDRGVDLIVSKPFRYNQVLELVAEVMDLKGRVEP
jgi:PAS domain S-box-containing protein